MPKSKLKKTTLILLFLLVLESRMNNMFSNSHFAIMFIEIEKCGMKL